MIELQVYGEADESIEQVFSSSPLGSASHWVCFEAGVGASLLPVIKLYLNNYRSNDSQGDWADYLYVTLGTLPFELKITMSAQFSGREPWK